MQKVYNVNLEYNFVVIAENETEAIREAKEFCDSIFSEDFLDIFAIEIDSSKNVPAEWLDEDPLGDPESEEFEGSCREIFDKIEARKVEEERMRKIKEEIDRKQLKFPFYEEMIKV